MNKKTKLILHWRNMWRLWAKAIGEKAHKKDHVADKVAIIRTFIFATYLITNAFIVAGVIRQWNRNTAVHVYIDSTEIKPYVTPSKHESNKPFEFE